MEKTAPRGDRGAHLFKTAIGPCALTWTERGIDRVLLPDRDETATLNRLRTLAPGRKPGARPGGPGSDAVRRLTRHLGGKTESMQDIPLDLSGVTPFARKVYQALRRVEPGEVVTYGDLAGRAGRPGAARAVGGAMARNPLPLLVPCHRVLSSAGKLGGFSAFGGPAVKAKLLFLEGVTLDERHAAGIDHLKKVDAKLKSIISRVGPYLPSLGEKGDPYGALVEAIIYQQLSMKAAATIAGRIRALTPGNGYPRPREITLIPDETFRTAGLSRQKISYLRDLASHTTAGALPFQKMKYMSDEAVMEVITRIRGFGRWSARMFLLFHLGRLDVLPVEDLGFRKGVMEVYGLDGLPGGTTCTRLAEKWRPYRSMATWYLWQTQNQPREPGGR